MTTAPRSIPPTHTARIAPRTPTPAATWWHRLWRTDLGTLYRTARWRDALGSRR